MIWNSSQNKLQLITIYCDNHLLCVAISGETVCISKVQNFGVGFPATCWFSNVSSVLVLLKALLEKLFWLVYKSNTLLWSKSWVLLLSDPMAYVTYFNKGIADEYYHSYLVMSSPGTQWIFCLWIIFRSTRSKLIVLIMLQFLNNW